MHALFIFFFKRYTKESTVTSAKDKIKQVSQLGFYSIFGGGKPIVRRLRRGFWQMMDQDR